MTPDDLDRMDLDPSLVPWRTEVEEFVSDGECLVYNSVRHEASALNTTATEIWQLCDGVLSINGIAQALEQRYGLDTGFLVEDVASALIALRTRGLVEFPNDPVADSR